MHDYLVRLVVARFTSFNRSAGLIDG
jgi:hypothetical protein